MAVGRLIIKSMTNPKIGIMITKVISLIQLPWQYAQLNQDFCPYLQQVHCNRSRAATALPNQLQVHYIPSVSNHLPIIITATNLQSIWGTVI